jgi:hypothetical protein
MYEKVIRPGLRKSNIAWDAVDCGTGKPNGCKSNGGCSTGGCNRMNVHDWLSNIPFADTENACKVVEVLFNKGSRKDFFRNNTLQTV